MQSTVLPILQKTSQQSGSDVRVVSLSSAGIRNAPSEGIIFPALTTNMGNYGTFARYGQSKAANILFASELARRYPGVTSVSLHPGVIDTQLSDAFKGNGWMGRGFGLVVALVGKSLSEGTKNQLWCATAKDVVSGRFYHPIGAENMGRGFPDDKELGKKLWDWTEAELVKTGYA